MKKIDIILAGVGGQGILSIAAIIAQAAANEGLSVRQSEVHGMSQRGGAVIAHLRIADGPIFSDLIPRGSADLIIATEPLESLRYLDYLKPEGVVVSAAEPVMNIPAYPSIDEILNTIRKLPRSHIIEAQSIAREAGLLKAVNMVMVGAASLYLPISLKNLEKTIREIFATKDPSVIDANIRALQMGRKAVEV